MTLDQRRKLLCLVALSGDLGNLKFLVTALDLALTNDVLDAAATGGHLELCKWLQAQGCVRIERSVSAAARGGHAAVVHWLLEALPADRAGRRRYRKAALTAAADAGNMALCQELLATGMPPYRKALYAAANAGHVGLTNWLLARPDMPPGGPGEDADVDLLSSAARGFSLAPLQQLYLSRTAPRGAPWRHEFAARNSDTLLAASLSSPTPDWRAKAEWLQQQGCRLAAPPDINWAAVIDLADFRQRLSALQAMGSLSSSSLRALLTAIVRDGKIELLQAPPDDGLVGELAEHHAKMAAEDGNLALLSALLALRCPIGLDAVEEAARKAHLHVLRWLARPEAGSVANAVLRLAVRGVGGGDCVATAAVQSGRVEVVEWAREMGCRVDKVFTVAAAAGAVAVMELAAARGWPRGDKGDAYLEALRNCDWMTVRCLSRLGCRWDAELFSRAVYDTESRLSCSLAALRWLAEQGCPVDWRTAADRASRRQDGDEVTTWLSDEGFEP